MSIKNQAFPLSSCERPTHLPLDARLSPGYYSDNPVVALCRRLTTIPVRIRRLYLPTTNQNRLFAAQPRSLFIARLALSLLSFV